jgi:hypothetical protein
MGIDLWVGFLDRKSLTRTHVNYCSTDRMAYAICQRSSHIESFMMSKVERDGAREERIRMEAVVDAYGTEEQAMGWY